MCVSHQSGLGPVIDAQTGSANQVRRDPVCVNWSGMEINVLTAEQGPLCGLQGTARAVSSPRRAGGGGMPKDIPEVTVALPSI